MKELPTNIKGMLRKLPTKEDWFVILSLAILLEQHQERPIIHLDMLSYLALSLLTTIAANHVHNKSKS